jgi:alkylation response protein AidB-like acyl-CoA dehydrogenase
MDFSLTKQQQKLVQVVRELAQQEIKPYARSNNFSQNLDFDWYLVRKLGEHNLICPTVPEEYGGLGLDIFTTALVIEEIAAACPGLAAVIDTNLHAVQPLLLAATPQQKERFLPGLTGISASLAAFALTEPSGGSDLNSMTTLAHKTGHGFLINGRKDYILNAPDAALICLFAMTDQLQKKPSLRCFIIPQNTTGLKIERLRKMAALDYARMAEIVFDNAEIDFGLVFKEDESYSGYLLLNQTFDIGRVLVGATSVGIARAAYELASEHAGQRLQYGREIRKHQAVSHALVEMATKIEMARLMTWRACWLIDKGEDYTVTSAMAKLSASIIAQEVTGIAAEILGARAYEQGSFMEELLRDARILSTIEGTNNIQRNIIASLL